MDSTTIAAIATPTGNGGIGIIKVSGENALNIASSIFCSGLLYKKSLFLTQNKIKKKCHFPLKSHRIYHGYIIDYENEIIIDEVLLLVMLAPNSYTREDVVEIHAHSGHIVLKSILHLMLKHGARLAEPGEFTKRAFLSGRIDLSQAEAVIDIINAKTKKSLEVATGHIKGDFRLVIEQVRNFLFHMLTEIEMIIDFSDDIDENIGDSFKIDIFRNNVTDKLNALVEQYDNSHIIRDGFKIIITGLPNVGKSSILNRMIQQDRAIVTPVPGTTRDIITETVIIGDLPVVLMDSAGLQDTDDPVEKIGIQKAYEHIDDSDMVIFVVDASDSCSFEENSIYKRVSDKPVILVLNKIDLVEDHFNFDLPLSWNVSGIVETSALKNKGFNKLRDLISNFFLCEKSQNISETILPNLRQKIILDKCLNIISPIENSMHNGIEFELLAVDIRELISLLDEITGSIVGVDVLDQIFSRFCIGK